MEITDIRINIVNNTGRLRAIVSIVFDDCFLVGDMKIIEGPQGFFVAMPCRKHTQPCPRCSTKNSVTANYCNGCGRPLLSAYKEPCDRTHTDIAHPINSVCRRKIEHTILSEFAKQQTKTGRDNNTTGRP